MWIESAALLRTCCSHFTSTAPSTMHRHDLLTECRILLLHGLLHLLGWDHELGPLEADIMAAAERRLLAELGWQGDGLISIASTAAGGGTSTAVAADGEVSLCPHRAGNLCIARCVRDVGYPVPFHRYNNCLVAVRAQASAWRIGVSLATHKRL